MRFMSTEKDYEVVKVAKLTPKMVDVKELTVGEVGVVTGSIKSIQDTRVGDTITDAAKPARSFFRVSKSVNKWYLVVFSQLMQAITRA